LLISLSGMDATTSDARQRSSGRFGARRVIIAGLTAGLIINLGEFFLNGVLLSDEWEATMASLNRPPVGAGAVCLLTGMTFGLGVLTIALYAILLPRFGASPRTAIIAAMTAWSFSYGIGMGWSFALGLFSEKLYFTTLGWSVVEVAVATLVSTWALQRGAPEMWTRT
jgi:hypothetical protein